MPTWNEAAKEAAGWLDAVLQCRILGHSWEQQNSRKEGRRYRVWFECTRGCGVRRTQIWDARGRIETSSISYPTDEKGQPLYLSTIGRLDADAKGAVRIETLNRRGEK